MKKQMKPKKKTNEKKKRLYRRRNIQIIRFD